MLPPKSAPRTLKSHSTLSGCEDGANLPPSGFQEKQIEIASWGVLERLGRLEGVLGRLGASWGHLGSDLEESWGRLGGVLEASWGALGASWGLLGASWCLVASCKFSWGRLGAVLGPLGGVLGASWRHLGSQDGPMLEAKTEPKSPWGVLGASWARLEAVLRRLGGVLGRISLPLQLKSDF